MSSISLPKRLEQALVRDGLLAPGDAVLVGVSGGPDSVALLQLLREVGPSLRLSLEVAHVDHGIRGRQGRDDCEFVRGMADRLSLPFHLARLDLGEDGDYRGPGNLEARARERRYRFFAQVASERRMGKVAVGHNRDDQVETMLMWLLRGCGPEGLQGMPAARPLARSPEGAGPAVLIRPLLDVSREDILAFLESRGLDHREDPTNRDPRYLRNWLRGTVLPELRSRSDGAMERRLARLGGMLRSDHALLERQAAAAYPGVARGGALDRAGFLALDPEFRPRMARFWLRRELGTLRRIGFAHVDAVTKLVSGDRPHGRVSLPGGWTAVRQYDTVRLTRQAEDSRRAAPHAEDSHAEDSHAEDPRAEDPRAADSREADSRPADYSYPLPLEGEVSVPEAGVRVTAWRSRRRELPEDPFEAVFDLSGLGRPEGRLHLRNPRPGDRFRPLGMAGRKKLKDLFIDRKAPRSRRRTAPLLVVGDEIAWIPGYARSGLARVGPETREVWRVRVSRRPDAGDPD